MKRSGGYDYGRVCLLGRVLDSPIAFLDLVCVASAIIKQCLAEQRRDDHSRISTPERAAMLAAAGQAFALTLTVDKHVQHVSDVYEEIVAGW